MVATAIILVQFYIEAELLAMLGAATGTVIGAITAAVVARLGGCQS